MATSTSAAETSVNRWSRATGGRDSSRFRSALGSVGRQRGYFETGVKARFRKNLAKQQDALAAKAGDAKLQIDLGHGGRADSGVRLGFDVEERGNGLERRGGLRIGPRMHVSGAMLPFPGGRVPHCAALKPDETGMIVRLGLADQQ